MWLRTAVFALIGVLGWCSSSAAQAINSAAVSGTVTDPSGAPVADAVVTITRIERNETATASSDGSGRFRFLSLPVGSFELHVKRQGLQSTPIRFALTVGRSLEIPVKLELSGVSTRVEVETSLPSTDVSRTEISETITPREIESLPLNGRNYLDLTLLAPSVSRTNTGNNERFAETSAVPGTGISVAGQRNIGNTVVVDGLSANDDAADLPGLFFSQEVIREFQVITSGSGAEFGRSLSGALNVVTQSGTKDWHGTVYGFLRNQRLDATHVFAPVDPATGRRIKTPLTQAQYGASAGGPLKRDRTFLFSNFEREDLNRSGYITISPANAAAINTVLDQARYIPPRVTTGAYPTGDDRTSVFAKVDHSISDKNRMAMRYNLYDISSPNARNVSGLNAISRGTIVEDRDHTFALTNALTFSATAVNESRFQYTRSRFRAPGNDLQGPAVNISGVANFGASTSSPTARDIDLFEAADTYTRLHESHIFKAGIDVVHNRVGIVFPQTLYGVYSFGSLNNFLSGSYNTFQQAFGKVDWSQANPNFGWFVQDEWRPGKKLTLTLGIRHDMDWLTAGVRTNKHDIAPRVGLAYAFGDRKTVLRAGFGQFYDRIPLRAVANAQRGAGVEYRTVSLQRSQVGAPIFPNTLTAFPAGTLINLATIDPRIKHAYGLQSNLQIERQFSRSLSASLGYVHLRGVHIIMQRNLNVPTMTASQDPVNLGRPNSNFGNINQYSGQGDSYYDGMTLSVRHQSGNWLTARVSYTLSKAIDNAGNAFFSSPQSNFDIRDDRGLSDNDQRHRLTLSGQFNFRGFGLSSIFAYASPYPFNIVTGAQTLQTTSARPAGVGRNTGMGFSSSSLDIRLSRIVRLSEHVKMELLGESFNILNRTNLQFPNNSFGTGSTPPATFGKATNAGDPRQNQMGLRLSW